MSTSGIPYNTRLAPAQPAVNRLANDLRAACAAMDGNEWRALLFRAITSAAITTGKVRGRALLQTGRTVVRAVGHVIQVGPRQAAIDARDHTVQLLNSLPARLRAGWAQFMQLTRARQVDEVIQTILTWAVFYATAGGADLEGGLPDMDLKAGIGLHRTVMTHSILLGMEAEISMRFGLGMLGGLIDHMPQDRHPVWAGVRDVLSRSADSALAGIWAGIGVHLLNDAGLTHLGHTKPVIGMPGHHSMGAHQAFLAANGAAATAVANGKDQAPNP